VAPAGAIAAKDLRRRLRDRTAILVAVILPFALAWIFSLTLSGVDETGFSATFVMVDQDRGDLPDSLTRTLRSLDFVTLRTVGDLAAGEDLVDRGEADAAFLFPEGFSERVQAGGGGRLTVVVSPEAEVAGLVAVSIARSFAARLDAIGVAVAAAEGPEAADPAGTDRRGTGRGPSVQRHDVLRDRDGRVLPVLHGGVRRAGTPRGA
jgi:ABC-2 type transport system permease protein